MGLGHGRSVSDKGLLLVAIAEMSAIAACISVSVKLILFRRLWQSLRKLHLSSGLTGLCSFPRCQNGLLDVAPGFAALGLQLAETESGVSALQCESR